ncbi:MAG: D-alanyl-D-alanine carboxypeptidase, partial [Bacteroidota bacterium]
VNGDSLIFTGTGDPSLLNPDTYASNSVISLLSNFNGNLFLAPAATAPERYGPGWAWDDFDAYYQPERSAFPIYGNTIRVNGRKVVPALFTDSVRWLADAPVARDVSVNRFNIDSTRKKSVTIPFRTSDQLLARLLADTVKKPVTLLGKPLQQPYQLMKRVPADSLFRTMMQVSDNFLAEQILMMASMTLSDTLDTQPAIRHLLRNDFSTLPQRPRWVDGSGLSRYNQITPASIVQIWDRLFNKVPRERLFPLLAASGRSGTMQNGFAGKAPFIFGKTGTLSNNYCLSGYLITRRGRLLIFSSMNANFTVPVREVRTTLEHILTRIHETY